jgi:hypothetical protein
MNKREFAAKLRGSKESRARRAAVKNRNDKFDRESRQLDRKESRA